MAYDILVLGQSLSQLGRHVVEVFSADHVLTWEAAHDVLPHKRYRALVWDTLEQTRIDWEVCQRFLANNPMERIPLILLAPAANTADKLTAFDMGCDDYIDAQSSADEICARINKAIYHQIANDQLNQRLARAAETARSNSDLGATIQFLLQVHSCDNLDQLGQQFFATIRRYGLTCSLQMRSRFGVKDMEAHGMAKDLESQLLNQLKDSGRFLDFGRRTIINYDRVSLLIKNMPLDGSENCDLIKENIFCLVQGINSRVIALEDRVSLLNEKESLKNLSTEVHSVVLALQRSYQDVMKAIVIEVENASERIQNRLPHLALTEQDEAFMEQITEEVVVQTNRIFNEGLKVDELFAALEQSVERSVSHVNAAAGSGEG